MGEIRVGYAALDTAAANIAAKAAAIENALGAMEQRMVARSGSWTGAASASFTESRVRWEASMQQMKNVLADIGSAVGHSNAEYRAAEARNAARFGG
ncbi:WXG100 family type VII secretion target [Nocardioides sp. AE5]|uniref:WXG100 family type VII secretion target n=1 Tax=Nocardioides sp. AE5 TaxID=2962573 RepID=UPI002881ABDF|nr:WXG100 family type VII secretion target [Nocardioides sp. AE5]MDT0200502.1 WXG100 family type VII secretion target [Nocardioides sp. AE5]